MTDDLKLIAERVRRAAVERDGELFVEDIAALCEAVAQPDKPPLLDEPAPEAGCPQCRHRRKLKADAQARWRAKKKV